MFSTKDFTIDGKTYKTSPFIHIERVRVFHHFEDDQIHFNESFHITFSNERYNFYSPVAKYYIYSIDFSSLIKLLQQIPYIDFLALNKNNSHSGGGFDALASDDKKTFNQIIEACKIINFLYLKSMFWSKEDGEFFISFPNVLELESCWPIYGLTNIQPSRKFVHVDYVYKTITS
jgi:hypothetical protein